MEEYFHIKIDEWLAFIKNRAKNYLIFAPINESGSTDYQVIGERNYSKILYNTPKPVTPLKLFFLPVKENVVRKQRSDRQTLVIGVPSCDLAALDILDEIYLNEEYPDLYYRERRENTILIGTGCHSIQDHCHCTSYGVSPFPERNHDISLDIVYEDVFLTINTEKGAQLLKPIKARMRTLDQIPEPIDTIRANIKSRLRKVNKKLPDYQEMGELIRSSENAIWEKYSTHCVSCGSCAAICPTCTCFLLIDRPGFEKVRQLDACQYPGFSRIAAGEDHLRKHSERFKNRYLCKYVWKPGKFLFQACTGCGRCIDSCIGRINKNDLFIELAEKEMAQI